MKNLKQLESDIPTDYGVYNLNVKEYLIYGVEGTVIVGMFAYVFYRSFIAFVLLMPIVYFFIKMKRNELRDKRLATMSLQFKELMGAVAAGLSAGYSVENAFVSSHHEMVMLFGKDAYISKEVGRMAIAIRNNANIEELLADLARRSGIDDIRDFAEVFKSAKRSGGDMPGIIRQTGDIISQKIDVKRRIDTVISGKKMEQNIMNLVPFGIILYVDFTTPGFFEGLYHNTMGVVVMTVLLAIYIVAFLLAKRITDVKV